MRAITPLVVIVEHNAAILLPLSRMLQRGGHRFRTFSSLDDLKGLLKDSDSPSCAIVDLNLPGGGGLEVQRFMARSYPCAPVVFVSGYPDVPSSVKVMKAGAFDLFLTPFDEHALLKVIAKAIAQERRFRRDRHEVEDIRGRLDTLTRREAEVLERLLCGLLNKQIAAELGTSEKTIKVHRGRIMKKMRVQSIAELVQLVMRVRGALSRFRATPRRRPGLFHNTRGKPCANGPLAN